MKMDRRKFLKMTGMTAVMGFGLRHPLDMVAYAQLPESSPLTARRWGMVIDLNKCLKEEGCRDCINACHLAHNVPDFGNPKDEIKWIWKDSFEHAFEDQDNEFVEEELRHAPTLLLCNHCDNPPCVRVCPTKATWKREDGIVMMDWHRCIGCRYCVAACPYGSRSFNWRNPRPFIKDIQEDYPTRMKGVVEKCTFCEERLAMGELPACVEKCKPKALTFGDLDDPESEVRKLLESNYSIRRKSGLGTRPDVYYLVT
jgi:Fe-S-cluster-containing dehydrogenase component